MMEVQSIEKNKIYLSGNIRFLRKQMSLSQEELAGKLGMNRGNIASYEKGTAEPKLCNLLRMSEFFHVTLLDITQRDLQNSISVAVCPSSKTISEEEVPMIQEHLKHAKELKGVLEGLNCYHCYKKKSLDEMPRDMQIMIMNFEKLFEVTQVLLDSHDELLAFIKSKCHGSLNK